MYAPENFFPSLLLYHLPTSDDDTTGQSLRPIFAVSTFAFENIVRTFTWFELSAISLERATIMGLVVFFL
jgi:hypothetical protein